MINAPNSFKCTSDIKYSRTTTTEAATLREMGGDHLRGIPQELAWDLVETSIHMLKDTMESREDNNKRASQCFYRGTLSISDSYLSSPFPRQRPTTCIKFWVAVQKGQRQ